MLSQTDVYDSFEALRRCEREGKDFVVRTRAGRSGITVMAPHGGEIEPGTSEIAEAIAGREHGFYAFEGCKSSRNRVLHLSSTRFDEPLGASLARESWVVVTIHGCRDDREIVYVGGRCLALRDCTEKVLGEYGFATDTHQRLRGQHEENLCNRNRRGKGVQVEISAGLRRLMFQDLMPTGRQHATERFQLFVEAVRAALQAHSREEPPPAVNAATI